MVRASGICPEGPGFNPRSGHFYKFNINCNFRSEFQLAVNPENKFPYQKSLNLCQLSLKQIRPSVDHQVLVLCWLQAKNESHTRQVTAGSHRSITFGSLDLTTIWKALRSSTTWSLPTARRTFIPVEYHPRLAGPGNSLNPGRASPVSKFSTLPSDGPSHLQPAKGIFPSARSCLYSSPKITSFLWAITPNFGSWTGLLVFNLSGSELVAI